MQGSLAQLDSQNPVLYVDFPQGRLKFLGTIVFPKNKYMLLKFGQKDVLCENIFENMVRPCWTTMCITMCIGHARPFCLPYKCCCFMTQTSPANQFIKNSMSVNCLCIPANAVLKFDKGKQYTQVSFDQQSRPFHAVVSMYQAITLLRCVLCRSFFLKHTGLAPGRRIQPRRSCLCQLSCSQQSSMRSTPLAVRSTRQVRLHPAI